MDWATRQAVEQLEYEARNSIVNNSTAGAILIVLNALERAEECGFAEWFLLTRDIDEFNAVLNNLYDRADDDRVWICTF